MGWAKWAAPAPPSRTKSIYTVVEKLLALYTSLNTVPINHFTMNTISS